MVFLNLVLFLFSLHFIERFSNGSDVITHLCIVKKWPCVGERASCDSREVQSRFSWRRGKKARCVGSYFPMHLILFGGDNGSIIMEDMCDLILGKGMLLYFFHWHLLHGCSTFTPCHEFIGATHCARTGWVFHVLLMCLQFEFECDPIDYYFSQLGGLPLSSLGWEMIFP